MSGDDLRKAMTRLSAGLRASLASSGAIDHALTKGEVREAEVIQGLRPHIPLRYELASGQVINAAGQRSGQMDVIVSDALTGTPFLASGNIGVFPLEIVFAVLQVKSEISPSTVAGAVENIASVKRLASDEARPVTSLSSEGLAMGLQSEKPYGAILAFSATKDLEAIGEAFAAVNAEFASSADRCEALMILDRALLSWGRKDEKGETSYVDRPTHGKCSCSERVRMRS